MATAVAPALFFSCSRWGAAQQPGNKLSSVVVSGALAGMKELLGENALADSALTSWQ
jgi:hypothetical protein